MRKNVVFYVTRQYMKQNRGRTFVTFIGIVFMVILMTGVFIGKDTGVGYLEEIASLKEGKWHAIIYDVTEKERKEAQSLSFVKDSAVSKGYGVTEFSQSANPSRPCLNVKAYSSSCFDWMNIQLEEGRFPQNGQELVISKSALDDGAKISVGDFVDAKFYTRSITGISKEVKETVFPFYQIFLKYGETKEVPDTFPHYGKNDSFRENKMYTGMEEKYKIVGIIDTPAYEDPGSAGYTAVTAFEEKGKRAGKVTDEDSDKNTGEDTVNLTMLLDIENLPGLYAIKLREIAGERKIEFNDYVLAFSANSSQSTLNTVIKYMTVLFVALIMGASALPIYNVFNMSFKERSRYLGMLCSVGATGRQKRSSIFYESFSLLGLALPLGILSGIGIIRGAMTVFAPLIGTMTGLSEAAGSHPVTVRISGENLAAVVLVSVLTVLISAWLPARKIGKVGPIECIRGNVEKRSKQYVMKPSIIRRYGAEGMLAGNMLTRQKRRLRSVSTSAAVFMVLLITTVYGTSAIHGIAGSRVDSSSLEIRPEDYDYVLHADGYGAAYETLKEEIENDPGTKEISEWGDGMFVASVPASVYGEEYWDALKEIYDLYYHKELTDEEFKKENPSETSVVNLLAVDEENLRRIAEKSGADAKRLLDTDHPAALVVKEGVISTDTYTISERTPEKYRLFSIENMTDLKLGDDIPMEIYDDEKGKNVAFPLENAGCVSEKDLSEFMTFGNDNQFIWLLVNTDVAKKIAGIVGGEDGTSAGISPELLIRVDEKRSDLVRRLEQLNGREDSGFYFAEAGVQDNLQHSLLQIADILLACFVVLTSVICLLNLFNSIRGWSEENTREFAVLRSVGMTKRQMEKMLLYECLGIILKAVLFAGVFAGLLVFFIRIGVTGIFGNLRIPFPVAETVLSAVLAGGVLVMFALLAHRRMNVREMRLMKME